jgi:1-acyl-sn-glycerol-3-phosphate acyltransferase
MSPASIAMRSTLWRPILLGLVRLLVGAHADWQGSAPVQRQRIYYANHTSHFDTLVIVASLPSDLRTETQPVAALDYWGVSALRRFIAVECLNAVLIDRSGQASRDPLEPTAEVLARGHSLILFPEGTRSNDGTVSPFRSGLYNLARRCPEAELVPVYLDNPSRVMPKGSFLIVPLICTARFGAPVTLGITEERTEFLTRARAALVALAAPGQLSEMAQATA